MKTTEERIAELEAKVAGLEATVSGLVQAFAPVRGSLEGQHRLKVIREATKGEMG